MISEIVDLKNVPDNINLFGGKAVMLSKLLRNGLSVPKGFVISSNYYHQYINNLLNESLFYNEVDCWLDKIDISNECIVRSSANVENTIESDCPGIFESYICHDRRDIVLSIKQVWESATADLAKSFFQKSINSYEQSMAVIVQQIKRGEFNLVIQSYDMIEDKNRAIIEYCKGELNSIVDDTQNASICYVDYDNEKPLGHSVDLPFDIIKKDCKLIESIIGGKAEIEAQIEKGNIWYLQARAI